jgi:hypothetical protein
MDLVWTGRTPTPAPNAPTTTGTHSTNWVLGAKTSLVGVPRTLKEESCRGLIT